MSRDTALDRDDREEVRTSLGRSPARVLVLGADGAAIARRWKEAGASVTCLATSDELARERAMWDVAYLTGALERERWDRWLLQRVHGRLEPGGLLVVLTLNLLDLGSLAGLTHLASRAAHQLGRRIGPKTALPSADRSAFRGRRYRLSQLASMVEGVGFEVVTRAVDGHLPPALAAALGPVGRQAGRRIRLLARRLPSLWGGDRPFPPPGIAHAGYRERHAGAVAARDAWRATVGLSPPRAVDVEDWARRASVVLSPHPDDEIIGCGGTLLDLTARGAAVTIVQVTDGSDSAAFLDEPEAFRTQVRLDEAKAVAGRLNARELMCLRADNRALRPTAELRGRIRETIERTRASLVFAPSFTDIHPDHQTVLRLLAGSLGEMTGPLPEVALYEVWSLVAPTHVHDVGPRMPEIQELLLLYETALKVDDYVHLVAERLVFNSYEHRGAPGYVEGFQVLTGARFLELASGHFGAPALAR
jgi:LmbE family N-acetylglucosaminyl deacetylase